MVPVGGSFGEGTGRIWLENVQCTGSERALTNCTASFNITDSCTHSQDAAVQCTTGMCASLPACIFLFVCVLVYCPLLNQPLSIIYSLFIGCTEGDLRLVQSSDYSRLDGRVEICRNSTWGTVCHSGWGNTDARVACRQLGFNLHGTTFSFVLHHCMLQLLLLLQELYLYPRPFMVVALDL